MNVPEFTKPYLETLTTGELARLADRFGIDIPPGLDRIFIIRELLDIEAEAGVWAKKAIPLAERGYLEPVPLPKQYNITYIDVLLRDPLWAFVFWEIKGYDKALYEGAVDFGGYCLKVVPETMPGRAAATDSFTVSVGAGDSAWYLGFPPSGGCFKVELCVVRGTETGVLAVSCPFRLPRLLNPPEGDRELLRNPLIRLSGAGDFPVLRNTDRSSRVLCGCNS
jgi:hypothetical protein